MTRQRIACVLISFQFAIVASTSGAAESRLPNLKPKQEERYKWVQATLAGDYARVGSKDKRWDAAVNESMDTMAKIFMVEVVPSLDFIKEAAALRASVEKAVNAGCDDPLLLYINMRYRGFTPGTSNTEMADRGTSVADGMIRSRYSTARKFYACLRATDTIRKAIPRRDKDIDKYFGYARDMLGDIIKDPRVPEAELFDMCRSYWNTYNANYKEHFKGWLEVEKMFKGARTNSFAENVLRGEVYTYYAWDARGSGGGNSVTAQGWHLFAERLEVAADAFEKAWKLDPDDPRPATLMLRVELGQHKGRDRMETWFHRAMTANPNNTEACSRKMIYLEPKWHGSAEEMLEFGRECVGSTKWGGNVNLFLIDAHLTLSGYERDRRAYYLKPEVWADIKDTYDLFLKKHPERNDIRSWYAYYASYCDQWKAAHAMFEKLGDKVVKSVFGGEEGYTRVRDEARSKGK